LVLIEEGLLSAEAALRVGLALVAIYSFSPDALGASFQDLARKDLLSVKTGELLRSAVATFGATSADKAAALAELDRAIASTALPARSVSTEQVNAIDYLALLPEDRARALRAKHRARSRRGR